MVSLWFKVSGFKKAKGNIEFRKHSMFSDVEWFEAGPREMSHMTD